MITVTINSILQYAVGPQEGLKGEKKKVSTQYAAQFCPETKAAVK